MIYKIECLDAAPGQKDNVVTVKYNGKEGTAMCSPDDLFDLRVGFELALERAKMKKTDLYVGDYVTVTNPQGIYPYCPEFVLKHCTKEDICLWHVGATMTNDKKKSVYMIVAEGMHASLPVKCYVIREAYYGCGYPLEFRDCPSVFVIGATDVKLADPLAELEQKWRKKKGVSHEFYW